MSDVCPPYQTGKTVHVYAKQTEVMGLIWFVPRDCDLVKQAQLEREKNTVKLVVTGMQLHRCIWNFCQIDKLCLNMALQQVEL